MSINATNWVWSLRLGDANRKLILLKYADHAHDDGRNTWVKPKKVAEFAECSERTVQRHISALLDDGFMREGDQSAFVWPKTYTGRREARYQPIVYDLAMDEATRSQWKAERAQGAERRDRHVAGGAVRYARGDTVTPLDNKPESAQVSRGDTMSPLTEGASEVTDDLASEVTDGLASEHAAEVTLVSPNRTVLQPPVEDEPSEGQHHEPADAASEDAEIIEIDTKAKRDPKVQAVYEIAREVVTAYMDWWKIDRGMPADSPIPDGWRQMATLVGARSRPENCQYVTDALLKRYTRKQVALALANWAQGKHNGGRKPQGIIPSKNAWTEALAAVAAGRAPTGGRPDAYSNDAIWGKEGGDGGWGAGALGDTK